MKQLRIISVLFVLLGLLSVNSMMTSPASAAGLPPDSTADVVYGKPDFTTNVDINADTITHPMRVAAVDSGGNLYVADTNNNRVLYYAAGSTTATRVYGQGGSFITNTVNKGGISADSLKYPSGVAVDSGGIYVTDDGNNRVLYYAGDSTTATRVYGQGGSFITNTANDGGITANSLYIPTGVAVDSLGVYVVDYGNNRVLYYAGDSTTATRVYGQAGAFNTGTSNNGGITANSLGTPHWVAVGSGGIYVADYGNSRVLYYSGTSTTATRVYGQGGAYNTADPNKGGGGANADSLSYPNGVAIDGSGNLYVADTGNHRVLYYAGVSTTATRVYGQGGAYDTNDENKGGLSADSLASPRGVAVDSSGNLYVADFFNNRVLYYSGTSTTATRVYGQGGSYTTAVYYLINNARLSRPNGVASDSGGNLYVADSASNRVLYYPAGSTIATRVYGQGGDFTTADVNKGGLSANSLKYPGGVAVDSGGNLYVADNGNNRVLYYSGTSTTATRVYGQGGAFDTNTENKGGGISATSLSYPEGVALDGSGNLYVVDYGNNRVLYYSGISTTATRVYGQAGAFDTNTDNKGGRSANSLSSPEGVAVGSGGVYVADYGNGRVLYYSGTDTTATRVYGQAGDFTTDTENKGGLSADSLSYPEGVALDGSGNVYVADAGNNRVLYYSGTSTTATQVYGQSGAYDTNTENKGGVSADSLYDPRRVAVSSGGNLYVADRGNNRVLKYAQPGPTGVELLSPANGVTLLTNRPTFDWVDFTGAIGYNIQISKNIGFTQLVSNTNLTGLTNSTYTPAINLAANTPMWWRVRAKLTATTYSAWSDIRSFTTANPPPAPTLTAPATNTLVTTATVLLNWNDVTMPTGTFFQKYEVQMATDAAFTTSVTLADAAISEYPLTLTPNTKYYWRVRTYNSLGQYGIWSASRYFRAALSAPNSLTPGTVTPPGPANDIYTRRPTFTWGAVPGATNYTVEVSTSNTFAVKAINATAAANSYTHTMDLAASTTFFWRVKTNGANGPSAYSQVRTFITGNPPSVPTLSAPANNALVTTITPSLDWNNSTVPAGTTFRDYNVQLSLVSTFSSVWSNGFIGSLPTDSSYITIPLSNATTYYWRVRSVNTGVDGIGYTADDQFSGWSLVRSFRVPFVGPTLNLPAHLSVVGSLKPTFTWNPVVGATSYNIQISKVITFSPTTVNATVMNPTYTPLLNLTAGTVYYWRVRVNGPYGPGLWSATFQFTTP